MNDADELRRSGIDRLGTEAQLRLLETLVRHAPVGIALLDTQRRYLLVNEKLAELNDISLEDHLGRTVAEVLPGLWPRVSPIYEHVLATGEAVTDVAISGPAGSASEGRDWMAGYYPIPGAGDGVVGIGVVVSETTDRIRTEREIALLVERERQAMAGVRASEASLRALLEAIPDFIFTLDRSGRHTGYHAERSEALFADPDAIIGSHVRDVLPSDVAELYEDAIARALDEGTIQIVEYALDYQEHDRRKFEARLAAKGSDEVVAIVRDMTEVDALEEQLRQAQKMEAVGRLAGGVAHDFNNLLTVINANSELLADVTSGSSEAALVEEIRSAGERAAALTRKLLLFSRRDRVERRVVDLNAVVENAEGLLRRLLGADVAFSVELDPHLRPIEADPAQIEHAIVNLCVNARDAMPDGGRLALATASVRTARHPRGTEPLRDHALLTVSDSGVGMTEAVQRRMFEPFFTTKAPGAGTGLGLSVVFGVMEESGGWVEVDSAPGAGSTFKLYFPAVAKPLATPRSSSARHMPRGSETILLVDDDESVRSVTQRVLSSCGYTVFEAGDGPGALALLERLDDSIDLLVADAVMPRITGRELADRLRERRPGAPVLIVSGYTDDEVLRRGMLDASMAFLSKPFLPLSLATRVREVLDEVG